MDHEVHRLALMLVNAGTVELLDDRRESLKRDLVCFFNHCQSDAIFEHLLTRIIDSECVSLDDVKVHLNYVLKQFEDFYDAYEISRKIQSSWTKPEILEPARNVYKFISGKSKSSNRSKYILTNFRKSFGHDVVEHGPNLESKL